MGDMASTSRGLMMNFMMTQLEGSVAAQEASNDTVARRNVTGKDLELFANLCSIFTTEG